MPQAPITVVIPTYNRLRYLREAVGSVQSQTGDIELIVVDDLSDDGTREWLGELATHGVRTILLTERSERSAARNKALEAANGDFILFLDDDDLLAPRALGRLENALRSEPNAVAAVGAALYFDESGQTKRLAHPKRPALLDVRMEVMFGWPAHPGSTLWRTELLKQVGGWPEDLTQGEDQDLWLRLAEMGPIAALPETVLLYRKHPAQHRPKDTSSIERRIRERFIESLPPERQPDAQRILRARELREQGIAAWRANEMRAATKQFWGAVWTAPALLRSPFLGARTRSLLLRGLIGSIVGPGVTAWAQRRIWQVRAKLGRAPGGAEVFLPSKRGDSAP